MISNQTRFSMTIPPKCDICGNPEKWGSHTLDAKDLVVFGAPGKIMLLTEMYYQVADGVETHLVYLCAGCRVKVMRHAMEAWGG